MGLYSKILGLPCVYKKIIPYLLGFNGWEVSEIIFNLLTVQSDDVVVDIGCGMGIAMEHIHEFHEYHGFDIDRTALTEFRNNYSGNNVFLYERCFLAEDAIRIKPTKVFMVGLLHHINDSDAKALFDNISQSSRLKHILTSDGFYDDKKMNLNNLLVKLDRGNFVRQITHYKQLLSDNLVIKKELILPVGYWYKAYIMVIDNVDKKGS